MGTIGQQIEKERSDRRDRALDNAWQAGADARRDGGDKQISCKKWMMSSLYWVDDDDLAEQFVSGWEYQDGLMEVVDV